MNKNFGFNEFDSEIQPIQPIGEGLEFEQVTQDSIQKGVFSEEQEERFGMVAENFSQRHKIMDAKLNDSESIIFQQDMIKSLLAIGKSKKEVKNFWDEYEKNVSIYVGKIGGDQNKKEMRAYFNGLKISVLGSSAVVNFFKGQGFRAEFPSVQEDMNKKCDFKFITSNSKEEEIILAVQIKSKHLPYLNKKEEQEVIDELILTDDKKLKGEKEKKDFQILSKYCRLLSKERENKIYLPVFINIPVTKESEDYITNLVDGGGKINSVMQNAMEVKWKEAKKSSDVDFGIDKAK